MRQETADAIIAELNERGWCKREYENAAGQVCLRRAVWYAEQRLGLSLDEDNGVCVDIRQQIQLLFPGQARGRCLSITGFNDDSKTTLEDVLLVVKHAVDPSG